MTGKNLPCSLIVLLVLHMGCCYSLIASIGPLHLHNSYMKSLFSSTNSLTQQHMLPMNKISLESCSRSVRQFTKRCRISFSEWQSTVVSRFKANPYQYLSIPIMAGVVGYVTNYVGVSMLFYPIAWTGIPVRRWPNQPLGLFGWQGIVPAKRFAMANKLVDVTISRLLSIPEVFSRLEPVAMGAILSKCLNKCILGGCVPLPVVNIFMRNICRDVISGIENIININTVVVKGLTTDPTVLGSFFQRVGRKELTFLVESGTYFGFLLGILQMFQWAVYPANWTLPVGGAVVGYITNWIALKYIFEPLEPTKVGPFILQGLFLTRQKEVSKEFCSYISKNVLNSGEIWKNILTQSASKEKLVKIVSKNAPFLSLSAVMAIVKELQTQLLSPTGQLHPLHVYTNAKIALESTLLQRMNRLSPAEFEQVLHPVFQEDELTLIIAGGVLGMIAGGIQLGVNILIENNNNRKKKERELLQSQAALPGDPNNTGFCIQGSAATVEETDIAEDS